MKRLVGACQKTIAVWRPLLHPQSLSGSSCRPGGPPGILKKRRAGRSPYRPQILPTSTFQTDLRVGRTGFQRRRERGQTLIYFLTVMAMLMFLILWLFDFNMGVTSRIRAQNGADAAALAAAQWQARSLNAIGEINLVKAIDDLLEYVPPGEAQTRVAEMRPDEAEGVVQRCLDSLQARINFVGPMMAMVAAQQAAKNNAVPVDDGYTDGVRMHAELVEVSYKDLYYSGGYGGEEWSAEYAAMLRYVADQGVAAGADNITLYGANLVASPQAQRWLFDKGFYEAIAIKDWCYLEDLLLDGYEDYTYWGEIIVLPQSIAGCEVFNLGVELKGSSSMQGWFTSGPETDRAASLTSGRC